jgi:hypothetical protein
METWRPIPGFDGYEASNQGRVRSLLRKEPKILAPDKSLPYWKFCLRRNKKSAHPFLHHLVLNAFRGPCPEGMEASHLNGDRNDNRLENLIWESRTENMRRKNGHGTMAKGESHGGAKVIATDVQKIRRRYAAGGVGVRKLAKEFGLSKSNVWYIVKKETWRHIR